MEFSETDSHVCSNFFNFMVNDVVNAALRFELSYCRVRCGQVEPLWARLQVGLLWTTQRVTKTQKATIKGFRDRVEEFQYLHENVFYHLVAVVMHADVTGEGLAKENIPKAYKHGNGLNEFAFKSKAPQENLLLPKVLW